MSHDLDNLERARNLGQAPEEVLRAAIEEAKDSKVPEDDFNTWPKDRQAKLLKLLGLK